MRVQWLSWREQGPFCAVMAGAGTVMGVADLVSQTCRKTGGFPLETVCFFCELGGKDVEGFRGSRRNQRTVFPELG